MNNSVFRILLIQGLLFLTATTFANWSFSNELNEKSGADASGKIVRVKGGGNFFSIPVGYFRNRLSSYANSESWWLEVLYPDFSPWRENNIVDDKEFHAPGGGRQLHMMVSFSKNPNPNFLAAMVDSIQVRTLYNNDVITIRKREGDYFGMQAYYIDFNQVLRILNQGAVKKDIASLTDGDKVGWKDFFIHLGKEGKIDTLVRCSSREVKDPQDAEITGRAYVLVPQCEQLISLPQYGAQVAVTYRRVYLQHWEKIKAGIESLINKFDEKNN